MKTRPQDPFRGQTHVDRFGGGGCPGRDLVGFSHRRKVRTPSRKRQDRAGVYLRKMVAPQPIEPRVTRTPMFRRLTALLSVMALANPLCCCWGEGNAIELSEKAAGHACCGSSESSDESPADKGDTSHSCPHENGAWLAAEVQSWSLVVSIPIAADVALFQATGTDPRTHYRSGKVPARYDGSMLRHPPPFSAFCSYLI